MYLGDLKLDLMRQAQAMGARLAAEAEAERLRQAIIAELPKYVATAEETAEAFVAEVQKIAPPVPLEKPIVVTPPDSRLAPPAPITIWRGTIPVDSRAPYYGPPPPTPVPKKKPGAGIGMALAAGAAGLLAMVAGG